MMEWLTRDECACAWLQTGMDALILPNRGHKPVTASYIFRPMKLTSLTDQAYSTLNNMRSLDVCAFRCIDLVVTGLPTSRFLTRDSGPFYMVFLGDCLLAQDAMGTNQVSVRCFHVYGF